MLDLIRIVFLGSRYGHARTSSLIDFLSLDGHRWSSTDFMQNGAATADKLMQSVSSNRHSFPRVRIFLWGEMRMNIRWLNGFLFKDCIPLRSTVAPMESRRLRNCESRLPVNWAFFCEAPILWMVLRRLMWSPLRELSSSSSRLICCICLTILKAFFSK